MVTQDTGGDRPQRSRGYKDKGVAAVLAFLFGGFGVHRFYLGHWWGVSYLLLFWTLIPGLIAFVEFIVFLVTSDEDWDRRHNEGIPRAPGESTGVMVIAAAVVGALVVMGGILAGIAVPAYQDYTQRAQMGEAFTIASSTKTAVAEFAQTTNTYPSARDIDLLELNFGGNGFSAGTYVESLRVIPDTGIIEVSMGLNAGPEVAGALVRFIPPNLEQGFDVFAWECESSAAPMYLPRACRSTSGASRY